MNLYFYTHKNAMFDYLGRNLIAPDVVVKDMKRYLTISTAVGDFLFVTHKKLNRKIREEGIAEPEFVNPITLELTDIHEKDGLAVLVIQTEDKYDYELELLKEYDINKHIGAFLFGEIPLSRINRILFDSQDDMDMFSRPSPDYWYPTDKYGLLSDDFNDNFDFVPEADKVAAACGLNPTELLNELRTREKQRAAILNFINGTRKWPYDKYVFNIDKSLQKLFGLSDKDVNSVLPHYQEMCEKETAEEVAFFGDSSDENSSLNQRIFDASSKEMICQPYNAQRQAEDVNRLLEGIEARLQCQPNEAAVIQRLIREIEKLVSDTTTKAPEEIMAAIPEPVDLLKALLLTVKNSNRYDLFLESLDAYHAAPRTKRRASVLWGLMNGLYGMPGEGFNKDNQILWQFIEYYVNSNTAQEIISLSVSKPIVAISYGSVLDIKLIEERVVTADEVRSAILSLGKDMLTDDIFTKLFEVACVEHGSKKKAEGKGYAQSLASVSLGVIKVGDRLDSGIRRVLEQLIKDCKTSVPNKAALYKDYVENAAKFNYVFNLDPGYWKNMIKLLTEKKNA